MRSLTFDYGFITWSELLYHLAEITNIVVRRGMRRQGFGRQLINDAVTELRKRDFHYVYLFTEKSNAGAQKFYEAIGFERLTEIPEFYRHDDAVMYGMVID